MPEDQPTATAEDLFAEFLDAAESGSAVDFDAFRAQHPAHAEALTRMHIRWATMSTAFAQLASEGGGDGAPVVSASMDALVARLGTEKGRLARYALGGEIARGAMGRVVRAWDGDLGREVALKIQRDDTTDARRRRRFLEEAQIAGQLDHPGIVPIHELGLDADGRPFFAMKLVRGRHLGEVIRAAHENRDGWSRTRVLHVLLRVCEAVAYAHDRGVVHRDLKPENVMVGRFGEIYVMDWGLALVVADGARDERDADAPRTLRATIAAEDAASPLLTRHGDVVGTPAYMAPEQAAGLSDGPPQAVDVYALGAILHHVCAGVMPYVAPGEQIGADEMLARVRRGALVPLPADVPPELRAIQERAMARDPYRRYPTVEALADDLRAFLELRVVKAYAVGRFAELRKWMARNRALSVASAAAVVALIVGTAVSLDAWWTADRALRTADETARRLAVENERSEFRNARLLLRTDHAAQAEDKLWAQHFAGTMPRATHWALAEMYARTPCAATVAASTRTNVPARFVPGRAEVVVGADDGRIEFRDDRNLDVVVNVTVGTAQVQSLVATADGRRLFVGLADGRLVALDLGTRQVVASIQAHPRDVRALAVTADGATVASGGSDGRVVLWSPDLATSRVWTTFDKPVWSVAFDDDDAQLAGGDEIGHFRLGAVASDARRSWRLGNRNVMAIAFVRKGARIWVGSADQNIYLVDPDATGRPRSIWTRNGTCRDLVRDTDGTLIVGGWWRIDRYTDDGEPIGPIGLNGTWRFDLDRATRRLVSSGDRHAVRLFDLDSRATTELGGLNVAMSGDGSRLAFDGDDYIVVRTIDPRSDVPDIVIPRFGGWLALDRYGAWLASFGSRKRGIEVYDLRRASTDPVFAIADATYPNSNESFAVAPDGSEVATLVGMDSVRRVRTADGTTVAEHSDPGGRWIRLRYTRDGAALLVVSLKPARLRVIRRADGAVEDIALPRAPASAAMSPDRRLVVVADANGELTLLDRTTGAERVVGVRSGTIWSLDFSPTDPGLLIVSTRADGVMFVDLDSGEVCHRWTVDDGPITQVQVSDDGATLAAFSLRGALVRRLDELERCIAGNLQFQLDRRDASVAITPERAQELEQWAARRRASAVAAGR